MRTLMALEAKEFLAVHRRSRFSEEQIIGILKEQEAGLFMLWSSS